ncbi:MULTISPECIES: recombinase family protein [unclassified Acidovorax]|uniref:recombinase family protein n=1 Tax=unclassified Acidovorax TaxID=2684926 RepID=UPI00300DBE78
MQQQRGRLVGYARVSTKDQETRLQLDALAAAGVQVLFEEQASAVKVRPVWDRCLQSLASGDVLVVYKLDRLARRCCTNRIADGMTPTPDGPMPQQSPTRCEDGRSD